MNDPIIVETKIGRMSVKIHSSEKATVSGFGDGSGGIQVGKFWYRVNIYFTVQDGKWDIDPHNNVHHIHRTGLEHYFERPAPTIGAKIEIAAKEALLQAIQSHPFVTLDADVKLANEAWSRAQRDVQELYAKLAEAQKVANKAEQTYYNALDRQALGTLHAGKDS